MAANRPVRTTLLTAAASVLMVVLLASYPAFATTPSSKSDAWQSVSQSWALGVVVPNGAQLAAETQLSWADIRNMSVLARLPNITEPVGVTYMILSAEGNNGAIFQVAAGIWPGSRTWSVFSWVVTGAEANSPEYTWILNCSAPQMNAGDLVSISMIVSPSQWNLSFKDVTIGAIKTASVPSPSLTGFAVGDQEVFALESYSRSVSTFRDMGNGTLLAIFFDEGKLAGGWYPYGGWDPAHSPLFVVGSSSPPTYISIATENDGGVVWSYDALWTGAVWNTGIQPIVFAYVGLAALVPLAFLLGRRVGARKEDKRG